MRKHLQNSVSILAALVVTFSFSSCVYVDNPGPPYGSYRNTPGTSNYHTSSYGYGRPRPQYSNHYDHHDNRGHSSHRQEQERVRLTGGSQRGKGTRPSGYHTRDWYEKKGYDLDKFKHKHEKSGKSHQGSSYKSKKKR
ncbi:MAG: hypothetical protein ACI8XO_003652 [Verrucomicrobiales bacterium]|jgi:hypothetical protein